MNSGKGTVKHEMVHTQKHTKGRGATQRRQRARLQSSGREEGGSHTNQQWCVPTLTWSFASGGGDGGCSADDEDDDAAAGGEADADAAAALVGIAAAAALVGFLSTSLARSA